MGAAKQLPKSLSAKEVAERLGVSVQAIRKAIALGELQSFRLGRAVRIPEAAAVEWLESKAAPAPRFASRRSL